MVVAPITEPTPPGELAQRERQCRAHEQAVLAELDRELAVKRLNEGLKREQWYENLVLRGAAPRRPRFKWKRNAKPRPVKTPLVTEPPRFDCPPLHDLNDIADLLEIPLGELRFLAFGDRRLEINHYRRFALRKKTGGTRAIAAPMPRLKRAQRLLYERLLQPIPLHAVCTGFRPGYSIVDNARPHVGADVVVNLDLQNFFPSIPITRVRGFLRYLGYNQRVAGCLARLLTEPQIETVTYRQRGFRIEAGPRRLPQGAPSSPMLANAVAYRMDCRLMGLATAMGWRYSRYADDLTFSAVGEAAFETGSLLKRVRSIIAEEGFVVHPDKTRIQRKGRRQEVTGLVVNRVVSVPRDVLKRFRALLHQIERDGYAGKQWGGGIDLCAAIEGTINYVAMVDETRAERFRASWGRIQKKWPRPKLKTQPAEDQK